MRQIMMYDKRSLFPRSLPGDFGFDPLNLGRDPEALRWYQQAELVHSRTAMTAVAGILIPGVSRGSSSLP